VPLHVLGEVVGAREAVLALRTLEVLLASVRPPVPRQLVGASEPPLAELAAEGPLARVAPLVGLEVGGLEVGLPAALHGAAVGPLAVRLRTGRHGGRGRGGGEQDGVGGAGDAGGDDEVHHPWLAAGRSTRREFGRD